MNLLVDVLFYCILFFGVFFILEAVFRFFFGQHAKPVNKIDRIRELRAKTGMSLQEAKKQVDAETGE